MPGPDSTAKHHRRAGIPWLAGSAFASAMRNFPEMKDAGREHGIGLAQDITRGGEARRLRALAMTGIFTAPLTAAVSSISHRNHRGCHRHPCW